MENLVQKFSNDEILKEIKRVFDINLIIPTQKEWNKISIFSVDVLMRSFGTYKKAWEFAGFEFNKISLSNKKDLIITDLKKAFIDDKNVSIEEIIKKSGHNRITITKYFGSIHNAFLIAKIEVGKKITDNELIEEFKRVYLEISRIPTYKDLKYYSKYGSRIFKKRIGTIEKLIKLSGLSLEIKTKATKEELLTELKRLCDLFGKAPNILELNKYSKFSYMMFVRHFGSYNDAINLLGYTQNSNTKSRLNCYICGIESSSMISHFKLYHHEELKKQEQIVLELYKNGLSARKISLIDGLIFKGGTSVNRVIDKYLTKEEKNHLRIQKIKETLTKDYASGKYDWVNEQARIRNTTIEARQKNSDGLKKAYKNGNKISWNKGLTKGTDDVIKDYSEKTKETMKNKFKTGEIERKIGPENNKWNDNREEVCGRYRFGLNFSKEDRILIKKRAGFKCEKCGISQNELNEKDEKLECDHIIPIYLGGLKDWETNGQLLCPKCHKEKTKEDKLKNGEINEVP